jgi:oligopeptide transport system permease protein
MHAIPGDPFTQEQAIPEEIMKSLRAYYGLDKPLYVQFWNYIQEIFHGNLGPSFKYEGRTVNQIIASGFPISAYLGLEALVIAVGGGVFLGAVAAMNYKRPADYFAMLIAIIGISIPSFILATFMQYIIAMKLSLLPVARWGSFAHTILPAIALAALPLAFISRLTRANMIEVLQQDYIQTARSKGLGPIAITIRHVLRNALLPVVTYLGPLTVGIMTGSFAIEKIFGIPGLGQWFVSSITNRDYTVIMGLTLFYSALLLVCIFIVDLLYCLIDPRIQSPKETSS